MLSSISMPFMNCRVCAILLATTFVAAQAIAEELSNGHPRLRTIALQERGHYVRNLKEAYARWCNEKANVCVNELLIRPGGMAVPPPYDQIRMDLVSNLNGKFEVSRYEHEKPFKNFKPETIQYSAKLKVTIHPFVWNRVEVRSKQRPTTDRPLTEWAEQWMDISDTKSVQKGELLGVVHSVVYPSTSRGYWQTMVDLGSAELKSLENLLSVLEEMGFTQVEIGSFSPIQR